MPPLVNCSTPVAVVEQTVQYRQSLVVILGHLAPQHRTESRHGSAVASVEDPEQRPSGRGDLETYCVPLEFECTLDDVLEQPGLGALKSFHLFAEIDHVGRPLNKHIRFQQPRNVSGHARERVQLVHDESDRGKPGTISHAGSLGSSFEGALDRSEALDRLRQSLRQALAVHRTEPLAGTPPSVGGLAAVLPCQRGQGRNCIQALAELLSPPTIRTRNPEVRARRSPGAQLGKPADHSVGGFTRDFVNSVQQ